MKRLLLAGFLALNGCVAINYLNRDYHIETDLTGDGKLETVDLYPRNNKTYLSIRGSVEYDSARLRLPSEEYVLAIDDFNNDGLLDVGFTNGRRLHKLFVVYDRDRRRFSVQRLPMQKVED